MLFRDAIPVIAVFRKASERMVGVSCPSRKFDINMCGVYELRISF